MLKPVRNPELRRLAAVFALILVLSLAAALLLGLLSLRHHADLLRREQAAVVGAVVSRYPGAEQVVMEQLLQAGPKAVAAGEAVLSRYGHSAAAAPPPRPALLEGVFRFDSALYLGLAAGTAGACLLAAFFFAHRQYRQINALCAYAARIKAGDYSLDIRDNSEGDLSLLKNEIYKITTMLREQAAASRRDRAALAASLADISHQLKTPLTSLFVLCDLLQERPAAPQEQEFLERMKAQLKRIDWLVTALLTLAKFDAGTLVMKQEEVRVAELVEKALAAMEIPLEVKRQRVGVDGPPGVAFSGDSGWSCEALINVIKNCVEHTPEGGSITIRYGKNPLYTEITVADSGAGIDRADLPYIFNRFYKGKNARDDSVGIGLAMARAIVERQGGDITVQSKKGEGTTFAIKFYKGLP